MKNNIMEKYSSPISYFWGALCTLLGALSLNDFAIVIGIILSVVTFIINWAYKHKKHKKDHEINEIIKAHYENNNKDNNKRDL